MSQASRMIILNWLILTMLSLFFPIGALAQSQPELTFSSPFLPVGSGARAMGMGGAFIAIADDATAASWNPAGLTQLKRPEISLAGSLFIRQYHSSFDSYPEASSSGCNTRLHLNYLSLVWPGHLFQRNLTLSLNCQHLYDMNLHYLRRWHYQESGGRSSSDPHNLELDITWDYQKEGGLATISPCLAFQVAPSLAFGLTVNFWPKRLGWWENGWKKDFSANYTGSMDGSSFTYMIRKRYRYTFCGLNYHFGFRWQINPVFILGGVMKTSFAAKLDRKLRELEIDQENNYNYEEKRERQTLIMPPSYGLGLAARLSDSLTLSLDLYRTEWDKHRLICSEGSFSAVTDEPIGSSPVKPTHHIRLGWEYLKIRPKIIIPLRGGLFYDPDPSRNHPEDFWGFSLGAGLAWKKAAIDLAYQFRFTHDVSTISFQGEADHADIQQHLLYLSAIFYF